VYAVAVISLLLQTMMTTLATATTPSPTFAPTEFPTEFPSAFPTALPTSSTTQSIVPEAAHGKEIPRIYMALAIIGAMILAAIAGAICGYSRRFISVKRIARTLTAVNFADLKIDITAAAAAIHSGKSSSTTSRTMDGGTDPNCNDCNTSGSVEMNFGMSSEDCVQSSEHHSSPPQHSNHHPFQYEFEPYDYEAEQQHLQALYSPSSIGVMSSGGSNRSNRSGGSRSARMNRTRTISDEWGRIPILWDSGPLRSPEESNMFAPHPEELGIGIGLGLGLALDEIASEIYGDMEEDMVSAV
jgi:hypothetical protein